MNKINEIKAEFKLREAIRAQAQDPSTPAGVKHNARVMEALAEELFNLAQLTHTGGVQASQAVAEEHQEQAQLLKHAARNAKREASYFKVQTTEYNEE